jgi:DNA-directed RNA polymerase subunit RPC12/RpoP
MSLIICSECNQKVSDQAIACPFCGAPISGKFPKSNTRKGKKWEAAGTIAVIVGFILCLIQYQVNSSVGFVIGFLILLVGLIIFIIGRFK